MNGKRIARVLVSDSIVKQALCEGTKASRVVLDALPEDAVLVAVSYDGRNICLVFESPSFALVSECELIPVLEPTYRHVSPEPSHET